MYHVAFQVKLSDRKLSTKWNNCFTSVDGTDFRIQEPSPFDTKWYSHKFNSSSLRYEIAVCTGGNIVWCHGPFPAGSRPDDQIFRSKLASHVLDDSPLIRNC